MRYLVAHLCIKLNLYIFFLQDRLKSVAGKAADNVNVATVPLFGHYYAATELPMLIEYDPITLETLGTIDLQDVIPGKDFLKYFFFEPCFVEFELV